MTKRPYMRKSSENVIRDIDGRSVSLPARVHDRIQSRDGHWIWVGALTPSGYGKLYWDRKHVPAHRFIYQRLVAPVPTELYMDHLCRVTQCVNPDHLEPVTPRENMVRGIAPAANAIRTNHCKHGHEYTPDNTYIRNGCRNCKKCAALKGAERKRLARIARHERGLLPNAADLKRAQTHCKRGHEFAPENTYVTKQGHRHCRECGRMYSRQHSLRQKAVNS